VKSYHIEPSRANYKVEVALSTMFASLQWVYIVKNLAAAEQNELLSKFEEIEQNQQ